MRAHPISATSPHAPGAGQVPDARLLLALLLAGAALVACGEATPRGAGAPPAAGQERDHIGHDDHDDASETPAVELSAAAVRNAGLRVGAAAPAAIAIVVEAPGEIHLDAERVLEIRPRFSGVVREIRKRVGDRVAADEVVAVVQSNESLSDYEIASSMPGTVIARRVVTGQAVSHETPLLTVADLSSVWADFAIYPQHVGRVRAGLEVTIVAQNRTDLTARSTIRYVGPLLEQDTRVSSARAVLDNRAGVWQPGLFVTARVVIERALVPVAVPDEAIVRMAGGPTVFVAEGRRFEPRVVGVGRSDGRATEIVSGLVAGDSIVVTNPFVLKSELAKGEVEHEH